MITQTMVLTINGTSRSEQAGGLDDGEVSSFETKPDEYRRDLQSIDEVLENVNQNAFMRGEWVSSLTLDGHDLIKAFALDVLTKNYENVKDSAIHLSEVGFFAAADLEELEAFLKKLIDEEMSDVAEEENFE